jgi:signal transduction histidine kinase
MPPRLQVTLAACCICLTLYGQEKRQIDSLLGIYENRSVSDSLRMLSLNEIAKLYHRSNPDTAILLAEKVYTWSIEKRYDKGKARSLNVIGLGHWVKTNHAEALSYYQQALPFFESSHDLQGLALCLNNIGLVYFYQGDYNRAIEYYERSLAINLNNNFQEGAALVLNNLGLANEHVGDLDKALKKYQEALTIYERIGIALGVGQSLTNIGYVYNALGKESDALKSFEKAITIQEKIRDRSTLISSLIGLADLYKNRQEFDKAVSYAEKARSMAKDMHSAYDERESALLLYNLYKQKGDYARALAYHEQHRTLTDTIFSLENNKAIASLEARVALEKKQQEFEALEKENRLRQRINYIVAIALLIMFVLSFFILRNRRKLKFAYDKLEAANSRLTQMKQDIEQKALMLDESNRAKDKMFSVISHDLRSPLNAVRGMFDLIKNDQISPEELHSFIPQIDQKVNNASGILEELLEWSKTQMLSQQQRRTNLKISELFSQVRERSLHQAQEKRIDIVTTLSTAEETICADGDMIRTVLRNLVANAIKFSRKGDTITLSATERKGLIELAVQDTGMGVKQEDLDKLFRVSGFTTPGTANEKGTGLGLVLCKEFVEKNQGTIKVESTPGMGTTFTIHLPSGEKV